MAKEIRTPKDEEAKLANAMEAARRRKFTGNVFVNKIAINITGIAEIRPMKKLLRDLPRDMSK